MIACMLFMFDWIYETVFVNPVTYYAMYVQNTLLNMARNFYSQLVKWAYNVANRYNNIMPSVNDLYILKVMEMQELCTYYVCIYGTCM